MFIPKYACETCGYIEDQQTDLCPKCGADDWLPIEAFKLGKDFFRAMAEPSVGCHNELYYSQDGGQIYDDRAAYWIANGGCVYHAKEWYLAFTLERPTIQP